MLDLESAIKHAEEVAEKNEKKAKSYPRPNKNVKGSGRKYNDCIECAEEHRQLAEWLKELKQLREQEPCDDVCEWFEQYVDIATDIVKLRFSDGTVKRAKRGLYMRDIEKSIRKMLIDQIANEKKQEPKWIPVSERLPESCGMYIVTRKIYDCPDTEPIIMSDESWFDGQNTWHNDNRINHKRGYLSDVIAWMPLPEPYKQEVEE